VTSTAVRPSAPQVPCGQGLPIAMHCAVVSALLVPIVKRVGNTDHAHSEDGCRQREHRARTRAFHVCFCMRSRDNPKLGAESATSCLKCPPHTTTTAPGASSLALCVCDVGRDRVALTNSTGELSSRCGCGKENFYNEQSDECLPCPEKTSSIPGERCEGTRVLVAFNQAVHT
jgi:hypothetical protein